MPGPEKEYDVIVIGGGINGLTAATYLQRSGLSVACFERKLEAGAGACTEEVMQPGAKVNLCASNLVTMWSPAYGDLELERFGLEMLTSGEWGMFHPFRDRRAVKFHSFSARKQYEHWASINEHDAELFRTVYNTLADMMHATIHTTQFCAPEQGPEDAVSPTGLAGLLKMIIPEIPDNPETLTGIELAEAVYHDEKIRTAVLANCVTAGAHPWEKGPNTVMPIMFPILQCVQSVTWTARGGSHAITHALCSAFAAHGGRLFTGCPVDQIIMEDGEAKGVVLSEHAAFPEAEVRARRAVISQPLRAPHLPRPDRRGEAARLGGRRGQGLQERRGRAVLQLLGARPATQLGGLPRWPRHRLRVQLRHRQRRRHPSPAALPGERHPPRPTAGGRAVGAGLRRRRPHPGPAGALHDDVVGQRAVVPPRARRTRDLGLASERTTATRSTPCCASTTPGSWTRWWSATATRRSTTTARTPAR